MNVAKLRIRPKLVGVGKVLYRCASCDALMEPEQAVLHDGKSYHPEHAPENTSGR